MNIACKASAEAWCLEVAPLDPGEVSLRDVQGGSIPLFGEVINDLISAGTIMKYDGHYDWVSPAFFVRKGAQ